MSTVSADFSGKSDAELINAVRSGTLAAYGTLYERHVASAHNLARQLARSQAEADDLVSEAFAKVMDTLRAGKGPDSAFRAYLLTALRHTAYDRTRKDKRVDLSDDMSTLAATGSAATDALTVPFSDTAVAGLERSMAARAFARLPERWQAVLWHTEIEQQTPAEVAPLLGLTPNGVSALAYRAREGLRQAYLQVHLAETSSQRCRATADRLGAWTRNGLAKRERTQVEAHLDECDRCRALAAELSDVNGALRAVVAPIVLGGAALGYLALTGGKAAAATAAAGASGGAAATAATAAPRQLFGVAASSMAIAAAVATALVASGGAQDIPVSAAQLPPVQASPTPVLPPSGHSPAAKIQVPAPSSAVTPPPTTTPPAPVVAPAANLTATGPAGGLLLQPGGGAIPLPITVRNDGNGPSDPVTVTLTLPSGVRAVGPGGGGGGAGARSLSAPSSPAASPASPASPDADCPAGTGTVSCTSARALAPGESAVLTFRLIADATATGGTVTGSISTGGQVHFEISVPISVTPAPSDGVVLSVSAQWGGPWPWANPGWIDTEVVNDGKTTKPVTLTFSRPVHLMTDQWRARCTEQADGTSCTTARPLAPQEHLSLWFALDEGEWHPIPVSVSATLGSASDTKTVSLGCWFGPLCHIPAPVGTPSTTPATTPPASEPARTTTSTPASQPAATGSPAPVTQNTTTPPPVPTPPTTANTTAPPAGEPATTTTTSKRRHGGWWWLFPDE
ncbi:sigma-70 family RNA polymerase sigma factor [Amycolatopsis cynarae]|uniref:Sigma-70 family RNA polymerase sigma factor n=1 Tax=Amycolatopsis cynarae TaxID=2995223 RepID=A0ABY7AYZ9_9PSEU|nr:sigma-70 family RNA polymerase sigma factor [Amycolatopsis sp. HUAS 11-8]WAL64934.1 sigma-70 family RNA polymerase sigma factor [Amycolatopsis sp. HUAS 11-8]